MSTLVPVISHALQPAPAGSWTEVCTAVGAKLVRAGDAMPGSPTRKPAGEHLLQHCPCCLLHTTAGGLPPAPASPLPLPALSFGPPELFYCASITLHAWAAAQPRAPPRISQA